MAGDISFTGLTVENDIGNVENSFRTDPET